ncbi:MAG: aminotransferase class I/II-fold pyridoxal phosphate-dependent enzyme, partial [Phycisphaerae bacterium]
EIVELLRQRSRPYLFSNTLSPAIAATSLAVLDILSGSTELRDKLDANTRHFREGLAERGFDIPEGDHPIVPIMLGDASLATRMADMMLEEGVYVIGFSYPVVPKGAARIRVQISAAHSRSDLDLAINAFAKVRKACMQ